MISEFKHSISSKNSKCELTTIKKRNEYARINSINKDNVKSKINSKYNLSPNSKVYDSKKINHSTEQYIVSSTSRPIKDIDLVTNKLESKMINLQYNINSNNNNYQSTLVNLIHNNENNLNPLLNNRETSKEIKYLLNKPSKKSSSPSINQNNYYSSINKIFNSKSNSLDDNEDKSESSNIRTKIDLFYNDKNKKKIVELIITVLAFISFAMFIVSTYESHILTKWFNIVDFIFCLIFCIEIAFNLFLAQHRIMYFFNIINIIDIISCILPLLFGFSESSITNKIVEVARSFRFLKVSRYIYKLTKNNQNEVAKQIFIIIIYLVSQILIFALLFRIIENDMVTYYQKKGVKSLELRKQFHEILYFTVVTIATVGYGDIYPITEIGRVLCMALVVFNFYLIPKQTNELIKYMSMSSVYSREVYKANVEIPHLVICGNVFVDSLKNFCQELFHDDHGLQDRNAVIIQQQLPSQEMKIFLHSGSYELSLKYLQGNPILEKDIERADLKKAVACVIMTDKYTDNPHPIDHKNILLSLYIKKYLLNNNTNKQLFIQLIKPENKIHYQQGILSIMPNQIDSDQIIIVEEIKMNLLSKSCLIPGIITMISNLVISAGEIEGSDSSSSPWKKEYSDGRGHEIYRTPLNNYLKDKSFCQISSIIYKSYNAIVFALEIQVDEQTIIRLNPGNFYIDKIVGDREDVKIYIYIICSDRECADKIENYGYSIGKEKSVKTVKKNLSKFDQTFKLTKNDVKILEEGMDPNNELVEEEDDYFIEKQIVHNNVDVKKDTIRNSDKITKHIVVCGTHPSLYYFILPLRAKYLGQENQKKIVILANDIKKELWDSISRFKDITLINGSPLNTYDLLRANIEYADKAVILDCDSIKKDLNFSNEMADSESIFVYKAIKKVNKNIQIMTELIYASNIEFLLPNIELLNLKVYNTKYESTSLFAAGEVYISSIIDTLTCQAYYNPHIVTVLHQLLTGGKNNLSAGIRGICENVGLKQSNLWQISIPEEFINKEFVELYSYLSEDWNMIPLGLYRLSGAQDNNSPYVYTNPERDTRLSHRDKVFVLAVENINSFLLKHGLIFNTTLKENDFCSTDHVENVDDIRSYKLLNKVSPFKFIEDNINEIEDNIDALEGMFDRIEETLKESVSNAVKQEISSLLQ